MIYISKRLHNVIVRFTFYAAKLKYFFSYIRLFFNFLINQP